MPIVGFAAGALSTFGYIFASPFLERKIGLTDTCGVFNLHGCPGILGGVASALFSAFYFKANKHIMEHSAAKQPIIQLLGLGITLCIAIFGGVLAGLLVGKVSKGSIPDEDLFEDEVLWKECEHED